MAKIVAQTGESLCYKQKTYQSNISLARACHNFTVIGTAGGPDFGTVSQNSVTQQGFYFVYQPYENAVPEPRLIRCSTAGLSSHGRGKFKARCSPPWLQRWTAGQPINGGEAGGNCGAGSRSELGGSTLTISIMTGEAGGSLSATDLGLG